MRILIHVGSPYRGFLVSCAQLLSKNHEVILLAHHESVEDYLRNVVSEDSIPVIRKPRVDIPAKRGELVAECLDWERRLGETFAMLLSYDRELGKGYIPNAAHHPPMRRSFWSHEKKLSAALEEVKQFARLLDDYQPELILSIVHFKALALQARKRNIPYFGLCNARMGKRYLWVEDEYRRSHILNESIQRQLTDDSGPPVDTGIEYRQIEAAKYVHSALTKNTWKGAIAKAGWTAAQDTKKLIRTTLSNEKPTKGYYSFGRIRAIMRRPRVASFLERHGEKPVALAGYRVIYFPLHLEPEISLIHAAPEFTNAFEAINWISKAIPADTLIVVKENPTAFGFRSYKFYNDLRRIGNVVLSHPSVHSWQWIERSAVVAVFTGTAGFEAIHFGRPVLSFGRHPAINPLPTVRVVRDYEGVRVGLGRLLEGIGADQIERARAALSTATKNSSFPLEDFRQQASTGLLQPENARVALEWLFTKYELGAVNPNLMPGAASRV